MLLTIAILHYEGYLDLIISLQHLEKVYNNISNEYKSKIQIIVSDNCSSNPEYLEQIIAASSLKIKLIKTDYYEMVDYNILNIIKKSRSDYVWILAVDDYINSSDHLVYLINFLEYKNPDILIFNVSLEHSILIPNSAITLTNGNCIVQTYNVIKSAGKISCGIYTTKYYKDLESLLEKYVGLGYLHLSYSSLIYEIKMSPIYKCEIDMVVTNHKINTKNLYHPKFSQTVDLAMSTNLFYNNLPQLRYKINNSIIIKLYWVIHLVINGNNNKWDALMLGDYINSIYYDFRMSNNTFITTIIAIISIISLILTFNFTLLKSCILGLKGQKTSLSYIYIHGDIKS